MNRSWGAVLCCAVLLTACEIKRTPRHLFDHEFPAEGERDAEAAEIRARIASVTRAIARGDEGAALTALAPAPDAYLITPLSGLELRGRPQIEAMLRQLGRLGAVAVELTDVQAVIGPKGDVGWFVAHLSVPGVNDPEGLRVTGVYRRDAGVWQLAQAHLSVAVTGLNRLPPNPDEAAAPPAAGATAAH